MSVEKEDLLVSQFHSRVRSDISEYHLEQERNTNRLFYQKGENPVVITDIRWENFGLLLVKLKSVKKGRQNLSYC